MSLDSHDDIFAENPANLDSESSSEGGLEIEYFGASTDAADESFDTDEFDEEFAGYSDETAESDDDFDESREEIIDLELADDEDDPPSDRSLIRGSFAGTAVSVILHVWIIANLAGMVVEPKEKLVAPPLDTRISKTEVPEEPEVVIEYELANPDDKEYEVREVVNAASVGQSRTTKPKIESEPSPLLDRVDPIETRRAMYDIPEGIEVDQRMVVKGTNGTSVVQLESALDLVTWEIAKNLEERKVLVVWLLDASGSLIEQRKVIAKRLGRIYGELDALKKIGQIPRRDQPILSGVVTFGERTNFITRDPTDDIAVIQKAVEEAPTDQTGVENVFTAVTQITKLWSKYRTRNGRQMMIVTVTDEAGDDFSQSLELAIARCRHFGAKAYVIGPSAVFGRRQGFVSYVAPENGQTYQLPIDLGPETAMMENVDLPFWFEGPQYTYLSSGFAPYALARMVNETGGVYFMTNMTTTTGLSPLGVFDSLQLKPFQPDYGYSSIDQYAKDLQKHPLRRAVVNASILSRQFKAKGTPRLDIRVTAQNFRQTASNAQRIVAESQLMIDNVLQAFPPGLEKEYKKEPSARWRMAYSLSYGRLLAQKTRCLEYNYACAHLKNDLSEQDINTRVNRWIFRPDTEINYASNMKRVAKQATELLARVAEEAPGTPWGVLASRELKDPLGIKIVERFIPPVQAGQTAQAAKAGKPRPRLLLAAEKKKMKPKKPAPPPKKPVLPRL